MVSAPYATLDSNVEDLELNSINSAFLFNSLFIILSEEEEDSR